ncbi:uncharacterized protein PHALS_13199 [Plasmopara halstedii]|uniref:Uncharacterized protein n=1 Tax=Plasmopara halstedii TaxID=4781 RepID=A0A0P1APC9_PLAHL|nr:uncharacterized protein PHALS_13199 [Plasmopara halstedii]CEG42967.1 hypothetical protein PHALS_13199 [Plasmopara halstedii]|eukprot:XP_024579336.1 hypothetical protein PHALS_13199 [Plasmopara halstedii]
MSIPMCPCSIETLILKDVHHFSADGLNSARHLLKFFPVGYIPQVYDFLTS